MLKRILLTAGIISGSILLPVFADDGCAPSWCQSTHLKTVEAMICKSKLLKSADVVMSHTYKELMTFRGKEGHEGMWGREVYSNQKDWVSDRNKLKNEDDVLEAYMSRTLVLNTMLQDHRNQ